MYNKLIISVLWGVILTRQIKPQIIVCLQKDEYQRGFMR